MANVYDQQFKDRLTMHMLVCDPASAELIFNLRTYIEHYRSALETIAILDPEFASAEGFNEWGEADCFRQAQKIAKTALRGQP